MKRVLLAAIIVSLVLFVAGSAAHAAGVGLYGTGGYSINFNPDSGALNAGGGLVIDTAVARPGFGYRFKIGYEIWNDYYFVTHNEGGLLENKEKIKVYAGKLNMVHTFCIDLISNQRVKFWMGPLIHTGFLFWQGFAGANIGLGLGIGTNIHLHKVVSLLLDMEIRPGWLMRGTKGSYIHGGNVSFHGNVGIIFRFGDDQNNKKS